MRFSLAILILAIATTCVSPLAARADDGSLTSARMAARRALEVAKIELRLYDQVEYPRQKRDLDARITIIEAEIKAYQARLRDYAPFDQFTTGRPLLTTIQDMRLCLLEAELRRDDLYAERSALVRFHSDQWRLLELRVEEARAQVAAIENGSVAVN